MNNREWLCSVAVAAVAALALSITIGCSPPAGDMVDPGPGNGDNGGDQNQAPTADAGLDQTATVADAVQLDGSGSSDPDGDALSFSWTQTGGTTVELSGADTATPSFTAPDVSGPLMFEVSVDDGNGGSDTDSVTVTIADEADQNRAPTADAGLDREVSGGDVVQLDGSGSSDPDGDALGFSWTQTGGTMVALDGADTPTPSFTAPNVSDSLTFEVTVDDGDGRSDTDSVVVDVVPEPAVLFVVNNNIGITSYTSPASLNGDVAPDTSIPVGSATQIFQPRAIVATPDGDLIISSQNDEIVAYNDGFAVTGSAVVDRVIEGNNTLLSTPISFAYDAANDRLYVGNAPAGDGILVFENVSQEDFSGEVQPSRGFGPSDRSPFGISISVLASYHALAFDTLGNLYAVDQSGANANFSRILVFADPETADNLAEPVRTIEGAMSNGVRPWGQIEDIAIDSNNRLYIVDSNEIVVVLDDATAADGDVTPDRTITVQVAFADLQGIAVSLDGTGYLADTNLHAIYVLDEIGALDGAIFPDRTIEGSKTGLRSPRDMFLFEPE